MRYQVDTKQYVFHLAINLKPKRGDNYTGQLQLTDELFTKRGDKSIQYFDSAINLMPKRDNKLTGHL